MAKVLSGSFKVGQLDLEFGEHRIQKIVRIQGSPVLNGFAVCVNQAAGFWGIP